MALIVLLVALGLALSTPRTRVGDLDPDSATPGGARAVAQVLRRQGVRVLRERRLDDVAALAASPATVLVVHPDLLAPRQLRRLRDLAVDLVLLEPDRLVLAELTPALEPARPNGPRVAEPSCDDPDARAAGAALAGGAVVRLRTTAPAAVATPAGATVTLCYFASTEDAGPAGASPGASYVVSTEATGRRVTVLGQDRLLTNAHLAEEGNAALAVRVLGRHDTLLWYRPGPADTAAAAPSVADLAPTWLRWVLLQLAVALLVAVAWRARRLGRLVVEPLPVVVRAAETVEGRARLYRRAAARGPAARLLRTAALGRCAHRLGASVHAGPPDIARLVARATGRPEAQVGALLLGDAPADDAALVRLAGALDELEREVRRP